MYLIFPRSVYIPHLNFLKYCPFKIVKLKVKVCFSVFFFMHIPRIR
jgi:hypothetical protein